MGGTNTDAVVVEGGAKLIAKAKVPTTPDVTSGISLALREVLEKPGVDRRKIHYAMLGTTQCTNAIVQRRGLNRVAVIRIGAPATRGVPPLFAWPSQLRREACRCVEIVRGGYEYDGREISPLDEKHLARIAKRIPKDAQAVAVVGVFSPVNPNHEERAKTILQRELGDDFPITLSSEIGGIGLLERENAAVLNAALLTIARQAINGFRKAIDELGLHTRLYLSQNDGTLMAIDYALRFPILTIACGPANSIRGAAYLSKVTDGVVVDIGGTTTDVGALKQGFPRESAVAVEIGGVRTQFRMPDIISVGMGGGSIVRTDPLRVGPESVGFELVTKARVFGGTTLTASDVAVRLGRARFGDPARVAKLPSQLVQEAASYIQAAIQDAILRIKLSGKPVPVVLVGGGACLMDKKRLNGVSKVLAPPHHDVANAIGAAIAQVGGEVERVFSLEQYERSELLEITKQAALERAVQAGAFRSTVRFVNIEEIPVTYLPGNAVRVRVKAVGDLGAA